MFVVVVAVSAQAASYTAEDLVVAHARGLPAETTARMAESLGADGDTAVYLLRRGVPPDAVRAWGLPVTEAEGIAALRLGALEAPPPGVSDTDWREMAELPTRIERAEGAPISGQVLTVVPTRAVLRSRAETVVVERIEARDVWVDATPVRLAVRDELEVDAPRRSLPTRVALQRRGGAGVAVGSLLAVAGGMAFLAGAGGPNPGDEPPPQWGYRWAVQPAELLVGGRTASEPSPLLMVAGAGVAVLGGVTFTFGADQLRLAANDRGAWLDQHPLD